MVDAAHVKDVRLTAEENETITRVGPGTPMGELMRRYWLPVLSSAELPEPDCAPVRVRILGEDLVAFRDTSGRIGLLTEFCAHRRTSLWLGRNEEDGLRCVFHGWKYDVAGKCVDMPNVLPEYDFKERVTVRAYPTQELGGVIWAYMGWGWRRGSSPRRRASSGHASRRATSMFPARCRSATGSKPWRQASTPSTPPSSTAVSAATGRAWRDFEHRRRLPGWRSVWPPTAMPMPPPGP